jgi:hypothetical protein
VSEDPTASGVGTNTVDDALADGVEVDAPPLSGDGVGATVGLELGDGLEVEVGLALGLGDDPAASCRDPIVQALAPTPRLGLGAPT